MALIGYAWSRNKRIKGFGLIGALVSATLLGSFAVLSISSFGHLIKATEHVVWKGELEDVRNYISVITEGN